MKLKSRAWYAVIAMTVFVAIDHLGDLLQHAQSAALHALASGSGNPQSPRSTHLDGWRGLGAPARTEKHGARVGYDGAIWPRFGIRSAGICAILLTRFKDRFWSPLPQSDETPPAPRTASSANQAGEALYI